MNRVILLEDNLVMLLLAGTDQQAHHLRELLSEQYPSQRWLVLNLRDEATVSDFRGRPDLTAKAQELFEAIREKL